MFLYTPGAKTTLGGSDAQVQSRLADAITDSNLALTNSQIDDLEFNLRHVEAVRTVYDSVVFCLIPL